MDQITISATETVVVNTDNAITIVTGLMGPKGKDGLGSEASMSISALTDVNISNIKDGSLLIYSSATNKWQASNTLNTQILDAGQF
jgi:hypothetical protein